MKRCTLGLMVCAPLLTGTLVACASTKHTDQVDNASLALLSEQQMQPVDDARIESGRARDQLARAKAGEIEANAAWEAAKADREVAVALLGRAKAETELLHTQKADRAPQQRAEDDAVAAGEQLKGANLKLDYVNRMLDISQVDAATAEQHVRVVEAAMERTKYQALKAAHPEHVERVNALGIDQRLSGEQAREAELRKQCAVKRVDAQVAYDRWQALDTRLRAVPSPEQQPISSSH